MFVEYKLDRFPDGNVTTPPFVLDGGHFFNPANNTYVGYIPDNAKWKTPDSVLRLTDADLKTRLTSLGYGEPDELGDPTPFTSEELDAFLVSWKGLFS